LSTLSPSFCAIIVCEYSKHVFLVPSNRCGLALDSMARPWVGLNTHAQASLTWLRATWRRIRRRAELIQVT
jgi:hypothetical protein